jgi:hypothetical protein
MYGTIPTSNERRARLFGFDRKSTNDHGRRSKRVPGAGRSRTRGLRGDQGSTRKLRRPTFAKLRLVLGAAWRVCGVSDLERAGWRALKIAQATSRSVPIRNRSECLEGIVADQCKVIAELWRELGDGRMLVCILQLLPCSQEPPSYARNGSQDRRSRLECAELLEAA